MERIALTNGNGSWFDADKAEYFEENTFWNGNNHISAATGAQWEHQSIYLTSSGKWILKCWSNWQGSRTTYEEISAEDAAVWFAKQGFADDNIPPSLLEHVNSFEI